MLGAEISPQVDNLPRTQTNQHTHGAEGEPLHALVGALVGVTQALLTGAEVVHLADNLGDHLLDTAEVGLDGLELLLGLDAGPVAGVGADFNVEFDFAGWIANSVYLREIGLGLFVQVRGYWMIADTFASTSLVKLTAAEKLVLKAHVEGSVRGRGESLTDFANDILRPTVVIAHRILNLYVEEWAVSNQSSCLMCKGCHPWSLQRWN